MATTLLKELPIRASLNRIKEGREIAPMAQGQGARAETTTARGVPDHHHKTPITTVIGEMDRAETQDSEPSQLLREFAGPHGKQLKRLTRAEMRRRQPGLSLRELTRPTLAVPPMILLRKRQQCRKAETRYQSSWQHVQMEEISTLAGAQSVLQHHVTIALHMKTMRFQNPACDNSKLMRMPKKTSA